MIFSSSFRELTPLMSFTTLRLKKVTEQRQLELVLLQETEINAIPEIVRILYAQRVLSRYGPNQVCRTLKIRKSNLYYHVFRKPELTAYKKHDQELRLAIQKICTSSPKRIGAGRVRQQLIKQGFTVGKKKVLQLLREADSRYLPSNKRLTACVSWQINCVNLLARNFLPPHPNMVWLSDITEIKTDSGTCYLCEVLDLFARKDSGCTACLPKRRRVGLPHIQKRIYSERFPERFIVS